MARIRPPDVPPFSQILSSVWRASFLPGWLCGSSEFLMPLGHRAGMRSGRRHVETVSRLLAGRHPRTHGGPQAPGPGSPSSLEAAPSLTLCHSLPFSVLHLPAPGPPVSPAKLERTGFLPFFFLTRSLKLLNDLLPGLQIEAPNKTATFPFLPSSFCPGARGLCRERQSRGWGEGAGLGCPPAPRLGRREMEIGW